MDIAIETFDKLSGKTVYEILKLRSEVFVVEQSCPYLDIDGNDEEAYHVLLRKDNELAAYCRILKKGITFHEAAIGRVVTAKKFRGKGYARAVMEHALDFITGKMGETEVMISAQVYLKPFYEGLGFQIESKDYLEDGIPHCDMRYSL